jgi:hypothetical protein
VGTGAQVLTIKMWFEATYSVELEKNYVAKHENIISYPIKREFSVSVKNTTRAEISSEMEFIVHLIVFLALGRELIFVTLVFT